MGSDGGVVDIAGSSDGFLHSISMTVGIVIPTASNVKAAVSIKSFFARFAWAENTFYHCQDITNAWLLVYVNMSEILARQKKSVSVTLCHYQATFELCTDVTFQTFELSYQRLNETSRLNYTD